MVKPSSRILYVTDGIAPWVVGGMQTVARRQIEWLGTAGFEVIAVVSHARPPADADVPAQIVHMEWPVGSAVGKFSPWNYAKQLQAFSRAVSDVADDIRPDLVYSEGPLVEDYLRRERGIRAPIIFHPHGLEMFQNTGSFVMNARLRALRPLMRRHIFGADVTISQGGRINDILERIRPDSSHIVFQPNCVPAGFLLAGEPRALPRGRFLFVGRDAGRKGLPVLLRAVAACPDATLDVVGVNRSTQQPRVRFHGVIKERDKLRECFDKADFLVVPSYAEGMPTVILEAFGAGLPVIATDVGAVAELVRPGKSGFLSAPGDHKALAEVMMQACAMTREQYSAMSAYALRLARDEFGPDRVRACFLELIQNQIEPARAHEFQ
ncbi:glycosyltransferase family 4 protein [Rhodomicrobium sp. Az07]|uniref:glycosyltransferase family 4 protein n=1 Tax=Rhodomicrobium sp. Az07 TaxID=2839034 RepID=UPI001BECE2D3|nr:glycosyltransferase family 4 protein [Rhodomicrobium sp. Az07]MBT3069770.1 glycosyltransferase family 4 protein [Rhodomicrobium sp. Az07]